MRIKCLMVSALSFLLISGCTSGARGGNSTAQIPPANPQTKDYDLTITLVEQEGDPRGVQLIMQQMYLPAYALNYFWSTFEKRGDSFASTREGDFFEFQATPVSTTPGPGGMVLGTYRIQFSAKDLGSLPNRAYKVTLTLDELSGTDLRRTELSTVYILRVLNDLKLDKARARLAKVELTDDGLTGTVWIAE